MKTALMFSGQGSQYVGMAADLISAFPEAKVLAQRASDLLETELLHLMSDGPLEELTKTNNTQPALFVHEALILEITKVNARAAAFAGHSLGEYSALYAAGALSFEDALRLVSLRGELMFSAGESMPGTMAAVVGLSDSALEEITQELNLGGDKTVVPANYNAPGQVVVSGSRDYLRSILPVFKERGAKIVKELEVSGAFHSPLMQAAKQPLSEALNATEFRDIGAPVYVNTSARPLTAGSDLRSAAIDQLDSPVKWSQTLVAMSDNGIDNLIEIGPKKVLQGLAKRSIKECTLAGLDTANDCQVFLSGDVS